MAHNETHEVNAIQGPRSTALWAGVIGAPAAWALQHTANYAWSQRACGGKGHGVFLAMTIGFAVLALAGGFLSWRDWRRIGGSPDKTDGGPAARDRFLGALGASLGVLSAIVIVAQGLANFFFDGCWN
jgi:hypothetical protein